MTRRVALYPYTYDLALKVGAERIDLEGFERLDNAAVRPLASFVWRCLEQISPHEWKAMRGDPTLPCLRAIPQFIAYLGPALGHRIYPATDEDMRFMAQALRASAPPFSAGVPSRRPVLDYLDCIRRGVD